MRWPILYKLVISSCLLAVFLEIAQANQEVLTEERDYGQFCSGMFSKAAIPGGIDPYISVTFRTKPKVNVAVVFYEFGDIHKVGYWINDNTTLAYSFCDDNAISKHYCPESQRDGYIKSENDPGTVETHTFNFSNENESWKYQYQVNKTGYYCVAASAVIDGRFTADLEWRNPYGELPASDYPKLPFYGLLSLVYLGIGIVWMILCIMHWREILPVQNYISGVILFLMIEMAFNWGYWENYNAYGYSSTALLCAVSVLNAGRNSISFFMLLIVCMGYGVVKPTLGNTMIKCRLLALAHFIFGVIYAAGTLTLNPDTSGPLVLLIIFPLALTMTAFHIWTLQSLNHTIQTLEIRRQNVKSLMYRRLYRLLVFSVTVLGIFFVINMLNYMHREDLDYLPRYWAWRWFLLDGWLNILYLIIFTVIIVLWRPTRNNKRFAMSEELGQDDLDDVEINNLRAAENLGYDNVKYRDRQKGNTSETDIHNEDTAIFDIGDEQEWTDEEPIEIVHDDAAQAASPDSPRNSEDDERIRLQQEINKLN